MKQWFRNVVAYIKNNPEGYWFKRKLYGWGWTPVRWQGWLVTLIAIAAVLLVAVRFEQQPTEVVTRLILPVAGICIALILICYKTGEPPKWQWGPPERDGDDV